jgi:hypothetical protein
MSTSAAHYDPDAGGPYEAGEQLLYHYTRASTALDAILPARTLRFNPYRLMRDPLENKELAFMVRYTGDTPNRLPLAEAQTLLNDMRDRVKLLSFTMDATGYEQPQLTTFGKGYARPRMWSSTRRTTPASA